MNKEERYLKEEGSKSRSGKTVLRIAKSGRKYYYNPVAYEELKLRLKEQREGVGCGTYTKQRLVPLCKDESSEAYMRYYEQKCNLRNEYPKWLQMSREDTKSYYNRLWLLIEGNDFQHFLKEDSKTLEEKNKDSKWEEWNEKSRNYNGSGEEYR